MTQAANTEPWGPGALGPALFESCEWLRAGTSLSRCGSLPCRVWYHKKQWLIGMDRDSWVKAREMKGTDTEHTSAFSVSNLVFLAGKDSSQSTEQGGLYTTLPTCVLHAGE